MERTGVAFSRGLGPQDIVECCKLAEELGYESAWLAEGHAGDQFAILSACAMATERILLGTSISSVFVRSAPTIAMAAATVDHLSQGRFILGLGSSHKVQVEPEHGLQYAQPMQRLRECVDIVRAMMATSTISYRGDIYNIEKFDLWFDPWRQEVPIYLSGLFSKMLQMCGEIAQGVILTWSTPEHIAEAANHVALGATSAGRNPGDLEMVSLIGCTISDNIDQARDRMRGGIAAYVGQFPRYRRVLASTGFADELERVRRAWEAGDMAQAMKLVPAELIDQVCLAGPADDCRRRLTSYRQAGLTVPLITARATGRYPRQEAVEVIRAMAPAS